MTDLLQDGVLVLFGVVGDVAPAGFDAREVLDALASAPAADLTVRLNSPGGIAAEGVAIFNALKRFPGPVTVEIDGLAASAASLIAMAGQAIVMRPGSLMMVHDPSAITFGTAAAHRQTADSLDYQADAFAAIYAGRTGLSESEIRALMRAETWMDGPDAVAAGFATQAETGAGGPPAAAPAFNYTAYKNAPPELLRRTAAWRSAGVPMVAAACRFSPKKRTPDMTQTDAPAVAPQEGAAPPAPASGETGTESDTAKAAGPTPAGMAPEPSSGLPGLLAVQQPGDPAAPSGPRDDDLAAARLDATRNERERVDGIFRAVRAARLDAGFAQELIAGGFSLAEVHARVIDKVADSQNGLEIINASPAQVTGDAVERFRSGVTEALCAKAGLPAGAQNEFSSMTLSELARASLTIRGLTPRVSGKNELVKFAFQPVMAGGLHGTSDFGEILADVASKSMLKGFSEADETFRIWTSKGSLPDFKPARRVGLNAFTTLAEVQEGAEYTHGTIGDHGEPIVLATYGRLFAITRQAIVNDDLSVFTRIPNFMGRAALRTIGDLVYAVLSANPAMGDETALFHADHGNLAASGAAPAMATINDGIVAMVRQSDRDRKTAGSNIRPKYILAPWALRSVVLQVLNSEYDPAKTTRAANTVRGAVEPVFDARLDSASGTAWYLTADQTQQDTVEVAYLDGVETPVLEQQAGWSIDGAEFKVRIDAGVKALAWEGLYKNAGA